MPKTTKKLVLVLETSTFITKASKKDDNIILDKILYIYYLLRFYKDKKNKVRVLINSNSKCNIIILAYVSELGLKVREINIRAYKINGSTLKTFKMVLASF